MAGVAPRSATRTDSRINPTSIGCLTAVMSAQTSPAFASRDARIAARSASHTSRASVVPRRQRPGRNRQDVADGGAQRDRRQLAGVLDVRPDPDAEVVAA